MRISFCDVMNWAMVDTSLSLQGSGKWYLFTKGEYVCYLVWFVKEYITFTRTSQFVLRPHRINNTRRIATRCITSVATSKVSILFISDSYILCLLQTISAKSLKCYIDNYQFSLPFSTFKHWRSFNLSCVHKGLTGFHLYLRKLEPTIPGSR